MGMYQEHGAGLSNNERIPARENLLHSISLQLQHKNHSYRGFHAKFCRLGLRLSLNDVLSKKKFQLFSSKETAEHFRLSQNFFLPNRLKEKYLNDPFNNFRKGFRTESLIMIACLFEYCIAIHLLFPFFFNLVSWSDGNKVKIFLLSFIASDQKCKSHICLILWVTE